MKLGVPILVHSAGVLGDVSRASARRGARVTVAAGGLGSAAADDRNSLGKEAYYPAQFLADMRLPGLPDTAWEINFFAERNCWEKWPTYNCARKKIEYLYSINSLPDQARKTLIGAKKFFGDAL